MIPVRAARWLAPKVTWLGTAESRSVDKSECGGETTGHKSGQAIVALRHKTWAELTEADDAQMKRVVSYMHSHPAQRSDGDVTETRWRYSLMNWGTIPSSAPE